MRFYIQLLLFTVLYQSVNAEQALDILGCTCANEKVIGIAQKDGAGNEKSTCTTLCGPENFGSFKVYKNQATGVTPGTLLVRTEKYNKKIIGCDEKTHQKFMHDNAAFFKKLHSPVEFECVQNKKDPTQSYTKYHGWTIGDDTEDPHDIISYACDDGHTEYYVGTIKNSAANEEKHKKVCEQNNHKGPHSSPKVVAAAPQKAPFYYGARVVKDKEGRWKRIWDVMTCTCPKKGVLYATVDKNTKTENELLCEKKCGEKPKSVTYKSNLAAEAALPGTNLYYCDGEFRTAVLLACSGKNNEKFNIVTAENSPEAYIALCKTMFSSPENFKEYTVSYEPDIDKFLPKEFCKTGDITFIHKDPQTQKWVRNKDIINCNCKYNGSYFIVGNKKDKKKNSELCKNICTPDNWSEAKQENKPDPITLLRSQAPPFMAEGTTVTRDPASGKWRKTLDVIKCECPNHNSFAKAGNRAQIAQNKKYCAENCFTDESKIKLEVKPAVAPLEIQEGDRLQYDEATSKWIKNKDVIACVCNSGDVLNFVGDGHDTNHIRQQCSTICSPHQGFVATKYTVMRQAAPDGSADNDLVRSIGNNMYVRAGKLDVLNCTCNKTAVFTIVGEGNNKEESNALCKAKCLPLYGWEDGNLNNSPTLHPEIDWGGAPPNGAKGDIVWRHTDGTWQKNPSDIIECPCKNGTKRVRICATNNRATDAGKDDLCYWACNREWDSGKKNFIIHKEAAPPGIAPDSGVDLQRCFYYESWCPANTIAS